MLEAGRASQQGRAASRRRNHTFQFSALEAPALGSRRTTSGGSDHVSQPGGCGSQSTRLPCLSVKRNQQALMSEYGGYNGHHPRSLRAKNLHPVKCLHLGESQWRLVFACRSLGGFMAGAQGTRGFNGATWRSEGCRGAPSRHWVSFLFSHQTVGVRPPRPIPSRGTFPKLSVFLCL